MKFENKKCDTVFHASVTLFIMFFLCALIFLSIFPPIALAFSIFTLITVANMLGSVIVDKKLNHEPLFKKKKKGKGYKRHRGHQEQRDQTQEIQPTEVEEMGGLEPTKVEEHRGTETGPQATRKEPDVAQVKKPKPARR